MTLIRFILLLSLGSLAMLANEKPLPVAIYSRVAPNYERQLQQDGSPTREYYAIGYGGRIDGTLWDQTQQKEDFPEIAGIIAEELAKQNYHFSPDTETADLLVVLHWGRTNPYGAVTYSDGVNIAGDAFQALETAVSGAAASQSGGGLSLVSEQALAVQQANAELDGALALMQMENRQRERQDEDTARIIGYTDELKRNNDIARYAGSDRFDLLLNEVQDPRYYVVVTAYDFKQVTENERSQKPLPRWVTRFSIRTRGNNFMDKIDQMALKAGSYFGRDSGRLIRDYRGDVEIGEMQVVGTTEEPPASD